MRILAINPGGTSTKIAVYEDTKPLFVKSISHSAEDLSIFNKVSDQYGFRKQLIKDVLADNGYNLADFDAVIGRGPLSKPVEGGVYVVTDDMVHEAKEAEHQHACDLGCILAFDIASEIPGSISLMADPGVVDELCPYARISGSPLMPRIAIWHALNQRAIARRYAKSIGKKYKDLNLIICHLGGGISVAAHERGRAIDTNNALDGEGPFSPERAGTLPSADLIKLCYSGKYTQEQLLKRVAGQAGLAAHLGTTDMREILRRIEAGDKHAELIVNAMIYHIAKYIAAEGAVLCGDVDAILLTGGIAYSDYVVNRLKRRVEFLAPVHVFPGEDEMEALALNALAVLRGEVQVKSYTQLDQEPIVQ